MKQIYNGEHCENVLEGLIMKLDNGMEKKVDIKLYIKTVWQLTIAEHNNTMEGYSVLLELETSGERSTYQVLIVDKAVKYVYEIDNNLDTQTVIPRENIIPLDMPVGEVDDKNLRTVINMSEIIVDPVSKFIEQLLGNVNNESDICISNESEVSIEYLVTREGYYSQSLETPILTEDSSLRYLFVNPDDNMKQELIQNLELAGYHDIAWVRLDNVIRVFGRYEVTVTADYTQIFDNNIDAMNHKIQLINSGYGQANITRVD